jgi:hypothetical protein
VAYERAKPTYLLKHYIAKLEQTGCCWVNLRGKEHFGRPRRRWEDNIKIIFKKKDVDWIDLFRVRDRRRAVLNAARNFRLPKKRSIF